MKNCIIYYKPLTFTDHIFVAITGTGLPLTCSYVACVQTLLVPCALKRSEVSSPEWVLWTRFGCLLCSQ